MNDVKRYRIEVVRDPVTLSALGPEWDALFERAHRPGVSQSFEWAWCVWETMMKPLGGRPHTVVIREGARLVLVWPLAIVPHRRCWRAVQPLIFTVSDDNDVLVEASTAAATLTELALRTLRKSGGHDLIITEWVRRDSMLGRTLAHVQVDMADRNPTIDWMQYPDWTTYEQDFSGRQPAERRLRRLRESGNVVFDRVEGAERQRVLTAWLVQRKQERMAVLRKELLWEAHSTEDFIALASRKLARFGALRFFALTLDDELVAVQIAVQGADRILAFQVAHDPRFEKFSPGIQIYRHFLRYAFEYRLPVMLGVGGEPYKKGNAGIDVATRVMPSSAWGAIQMAIRGLRAWKVQRHIARAAREADQAALPARESPPEERARG